MSYNNYATFENKRLIGSLRGKASQRWSEIDRLEITENLPPIRPIEPILLMVVNTFNPISEVRNHIEIKHEIDCGSGKANVYVNNEKWRNGWSKSRFGLWIAGQIDMVQLT